jgi:hypothetical protein
VAVAVAVEHTAVAVAAVDLLIPMLLLLQELSIPSQSVLQELDQPAKVFMVVMAATQ